MQEQIAKDLKTAMLARDQQTVSVLRGLNSAIKNEQIANKGELRDQDILKVVKKQAKQRQESADMYTKAGEQARADAELAEKAIIDKYLPEQLSDEQVTAMVDEVIAELGDQASKGQVIQKTIAKAAGQADGGTVAKIVNQKLN